VKNRLGANFALMNADRQQRQVAKTFTLESVTRSVNIRQVLEALEFARREVFRTGSPDFLRARVSEDRVQRLCERLIRGQADRDPKRSSEPK
jgi:hypothetical protein